MTWIKTADELPPEGETVLGTNSPHEEVLLVSYENGRWYWRQIQLETKNGPIYWHNIPPMHFYVYAPTIRDKSDFIDNYLTLEKLQQSVKEIQERMKKYVDEHGNVELDSTHNWGNHTVNVERINLNPIGINLLTSQNLQNAIKITTNKTLIKNVIRDHGLPIEKTLESVVEDLRKHHCIITDKQERYGKFKP